MKAILISFIDSSNIGDQLIVETLSNLLEKNYEIKKYSYGLLTKENINIKRNIPKLDSKAKKIYKNNFRKLFLFDYSHSLYNKYKIKNNKNWDKFILDLQNADVLVFGGGNAIFDLTKLSVSSYKFKLIIEKAKESDVRIFASSIGIGPFITDKQRKQAIDILENCDYVTLRDEKSLSYFKGSEDKEKIFTSVDPVFLLNKYEKYRPKEIKKEIHIGICLIDYRLNKVNEKSYTDYIVSVVSLIKKILKNEDYKVTLFSSEIRDYQAVKDVAKYFNSKRVSIEVIKDKIELLELYSNVDLVIGTRMHSMIVALSQNIPVIGLAWQPKVTEMFRILEQMDSVFDINNIAESEDQILSLVDQKMYNLKQEKEKLEEFKDNMEKNFSINEEILLKLRKRNI